MSTAIRVVTGESVTSAARTQPSTPFGLIGSCTRSQRGAQPRSIRPRTEKTFGTRFTFRSPNRANAPWPGERKACVGRRTSAAHAIRVEPTAWNPELQRRVACAAATPLCSCMPQPAASRAATASVTQVREREITLCSLSLRPFVLLPWVNDGRAAEGAPVPAPPPQRGCQPRARPAGRRALRARAQRLQDLRPRARPAGSEARRRLGRFRGLRAAAVLLLVGLLAGTAAAATVRGTVRADRLMAAFGGADTVRCGAGRDLAVGDRQDKVSADCETIVRRLSVDAFKDPASQHETAVEPDSFAWGSMVVAAFQVGRFKSGASDGIGFATSKNAGRTWTTGMLPGLTVQTRPAGTWIRASDPSIAYDAVHGVWLTATLVLGPGNESSGMTISRAHDGVHWTAPVVTATGPGLDKEWLACDNGSASQFRGRCYLVYTDDDLHRISLQISDDGGSSWSPPARIAGELIGALPVIQPDGTVTVIVGGFPDNNTGTMFAVRSTDGGATFAQPAKISDVQWRLAHRMPPPPLPSPAVASAGASLTLWLGLPLPTLVPGNFR